MPIGTLDCFSFSSIWLSGFCLWISGVYPKFCPHPAKSCPIKYCIRHLFWNRMFLKKTPKHLQLVFHFVFKLIHGKRNSFLISDRFLSFILYFFFPFLKQEVSIFMKTGDHSNSNPDRCIHGDNSVTVISYNGLTCHNGNLQWNCYCYHVVN